MPAVATTALLGYHPDGTIRHATATFCAITGWHLNDLIGTNAYDYVHPDELQEAHHRVNLHEQGIFSYGYISRWRRPDNTYMTISWSSIDIDGQPYVHALPIPDWLHGYVAPTSDTDVVTDIDAATSQRHEGPGKMNGDTCANCDRLNAELAALKHNIAGLAAAMLTATQSPSPDAPIQES